MVWLTLVLGIILANPVHNARRDPNKVAQWNWGEGTSTSRRNDGHMFSYGAEVGDEMIDAGDLPTIRPSYRKPWDSIKLFADGHLELVNQKATPQYTGFIAPFHVPHSEITSGNVWFRETDDKPSLDLVQSEINDVFGNDGFRSDPDAMIVVTWVFDDVRPVYLECNDANRPDNEDFCTCVDNKYYPYPHHIECECEYFVNNTEFYCSLTTAYGYRDMRYAHCITDGHHGRANDRYIYCPCIARGRSTSAAFCSGSGFNAFSTQFIQTTVNPTESCDWCQCVSERGYDNTDYCRCHSYDVYIEMGRLKCFLTMIILNNADKFNTSTVPLPDTLTEFDLMEDLLARDFHDEIWLCEDDDLDLDYCKCINMRTAGDRDDEIYCKCAVYSAGGGHDLCQCLDDEDYGGSESCAGGSSVGPGNSQEVPIGQNFSIDPMNTFQAVIVYNDEQTFVYFTYSRLYYSDKDVTTKVGIKNTRTSAFYGYTHPYPDDASLINFLLYDSNMGDPGVWIYSMDRSVTEASWTPSSSTIPGFYG